MLIIEVLSESTHKSDLDIRRGKGYSYAAAGVREYLAFDPTGEFAPPYGRGWRLEGQSYEPWEPDAEGRWQSSAIPIAIGVDGEMVAVYTREGRRLPCEDYPYPFIGTYAANLISQEELPTEIR